MESGLKLLKSKSHQIKLTNECKLNITQPLLDQNFICKMNITNYLYNSSDFPYLPIIIIDSINYEF